MTAVHPETRSRTTSRKDDRLYIRITQEQKSALARAARARHQRTTEFVLQASLEVAEVVASQEERIVLSERDFARFVESINNPKPPTPELRASMTEYRRLKADHPESNL